MQASGREQDALASGDFPTEAIRRAVAGLEYSDKTSAEIITLVQGWKDPQGRMFFLAQGRSLARARDACQAGEISREQLVQTERAVTRALGQCVRRGIAYRSDYFDLSEVVAAKKANCLGYSQLLCVLGHSIGLSVSAVTVVEPSSRSPVTVPGHIANIVSLSDDTAVIVDLTRSDGFVSQPLAFDTSSETPADRHRRRNDASAPEDRPSGPVSYAHAEAEQLPIVWAPTKQGHPGQKDAKTIRVLNDDELVAELHFSRGVVCNQLGRDAQALLHYGKAIEHHERFARAYNNRGAVLLLQAKYETAIADFDRAVALHPRFAQAYQNRGGAYLGTAQYEQAISDYTTAISLYPESSDTFLCRGFARVQLGRYAEGISDYTRAIALRPGSAGAYYRRAIAYARVGEDEKARADLVKAVALDRTVIARATRVSDDFRLNLTFN